MIPELKQYALPNNEVVVWNKYAADLRNYNTYLYSIWMLKVSEIIPERSGDGDPNRDPTYVIKRYPQNDWEVYTGIGSTLYLNNDKVKTYIKNKYELCKKQLLQLKKEFRDTDIKFLKNTNKSSLYDYCWEISIHCNWIDLCTKYDIYHYHIRILLDNIFNDDGELLFQVNGFIKTDPQYYNKESQEVIRSCYTIVKSHVDVVRKNTLSLDKIIEEIRKMLTDLKNIETTADIVEDLSTKANEEETRRKQAEEILKNSNLFAIIYGYMNNGKFYPTESFRRCRDISDLRAHTEAVELRYHPHGSVRVVYKDDITESKNSCESKENSYHSINENSFSDDIYDLKKRG